MKIYTVEPSCSVRTDRLAKLIISFRSFANAPKNCIVILDHGEPPYRRMCVCVCVCVCVHIWHMPIESRLSRFLICECLVRSYYSPSLEWR